MLARMFSGENAPTRLPPPPRVVHGGAGCGLWLLRLFILPHICAGVFMAGQLVLTLLVASFGTDKAALVTKAHTRQSSKGGMIYYLDYRYSADGQAYTNSESVGAGTYAAVSRPEDLEGRAATVRVRHLGFGPLHYHVLTQEHSAWMSAGGLLFVVLFWNGFLSMFVFLAWVAPIRRRSLVRHGCETQGTIVGRRVRTGKSTIYFTTFRFKEPETGLELEREMEVPGVALYALAQAGREVTVLYDPRKPRRAVIYEFCGYRVAKPELG